MLPSRWQVLVLPTASRRSPGLCNREQSLLLQVAGSNYGSSVRCTGRAVRAVRYTYDDRIPSFISSTAVHLSHSPCGGRMWDTMPSLGLVKYLFIIPILTKSIVESLFPNSHISISGFPAAAEQSSEMYDHHEAICRCPALGTAFFLVKCRHDVVVRSLPFVSMKFEVSHFEPLELTP